MVTAASRAERIWIPRLPGLCCVHTPMGVGAGDSLSRSLQGLDTPSTIVSTGFCGGLCTSVPAGTVVIGNTIEYEGERITVDAALVERARRALTIANLPFLVGKIATTRSVAKSSQEKKNLARTGAIAVDMESGPLGRVALAAGIGFLPLRVVLDTRDRPLLFNADRSDLLVALAHPICTLQLLRAVIIAGRMIGRAIAAIVTEFATRREECVA
ncbi:MAG: hypothetical protein U9Q94_08435 [Candidatus Bipolaricaulota bacterium]|nr:hypothetical protein [Candidatus Bipolaricaulota bacterium]